MEQELKSLSSDELVKLYYTVNSELTKQLLNGSPWNEQQGRIGTLSQISRELSQRRIIMSDKPVEDINDNRSESLKPPNKP
jgi:hypothetical protein